MTEGKKNLIQGLFGEDDIQEALKYLLSGTIRGMLVIEMGNHIGYVCYERSGEPNYLNFPCMQKE